MTAAKEADFFYLVEENRKIARRLLQVKLDIHFNKEESFYMKLQKEKREEKLKQTKKAKENLERKKEFKEREELE